MIFPAHRIIWSAPLIGAFCVLATAMPPAVASPGITLSDDAGNQVTLDAPAARIVSLAPHITELLFAVGAGDAVIATVQYSDYPGQALELPRVGDARSVDLEAVLALKPDLVIAWRSAPQGGAARRLRQLGIPVYFSEPRSLEDIASALQRLGRLTGNGARGKTEAEAFRQRVNALSAEYAVADAEPLRVFYEIWHQPLMTVGGEHFISEVIALCGGRNIFDELRAPAPRVDLEAVLSRDPQIILGGGGEGRALVERWNTRASVTAVQLEQIHAVPGELLGRPTPRLLDGAAVVCEKLRQARKSG